MTTFQTFATHTNAMRLGLSLVVVLTVSNAQGIEQNCETAVGREYYAAAKFAKAAAVFQVACKASNDADACYWAGMAYEKLADIAMPYGCHISAKAHQYFTDALKLAPGRPTYRDALFEFLLNTADCSRTALREAAAILAAIPKSGPEHGDMLCRLENERLISASLDARLSRLFLMVPRAAHGINVLLGPLLTDRAAVGSCCASSCSGTLHTTSAECASTRASNRPSPTCSSSRVRQERKGRRETFN